jgi:hypothetical protein
MKFSALLILIGLLLPIASCGKAASMCPLPSGTPEYLTEHPSELATPTPVLEPIQARIGNDTLFVDKVVEGALCNDTWRGIVYVTCNIEVYAWTEEPTFLRDCQLNIEPQTVVYVADHNNAAYYNGCSCHTGITPEP